MRKYPSGLCVFAAPKKFTVNSIEDFLKEFEVVFSWKEKMVPNVHFDFLSLKSINIIGLLLIYKIIDFTYINHCFKKPELHPSDELKNAWLEYEFMDLIDAYISNRDITEKAYKEMKVKVEDQFIIAPQALLRNSVYTNQYLQQEFLPKISHHYSYNEKIVTNVFTCLSEILLNFWEHAVEDTKSIILASGNKAKVEIACADTGKGIISNLLPFFPELSHRPEEILAKSLCKGVTSKLNTYHMGYGLWILDEIISNNQSRLHIYSEGFFYKNDYGKITKGKCGYWKGSIIYINLDVTNPKTPVDFNLIDYREFKELKIQFT